MGKTSRSIQKDLGNCCLCIPIRIGVGIACLYTFIHGLICILVFVNQDVRLLQGGYNPQTRWWGVALGQLGVIFGITGLMGVADQKPNWIKFYNYFQWSKCLASAIIFVMDQTTLNGCESYSYNIHSQISFNPNIEPIALKGLCGWTRDAYWVGFAIDFWFQVYMAYIGQCYYSILLVKPAYMIKFRPEFEPVLSRESVGEPGMYMKFEDLKANQPAPQFQGALGAQGEDLGPTPLYSNRGQGGGYGSVGGSSGGRINLAPSGAGI